VRGGGAGRCGSRQPAPSSRRWQLAMIPLRPADEALKRLAESRRAAAVNGSFVDASNWCRPG